MRVPVKPLIFCVFAAVPSCAADDDAVPASVETSNAPPAGSLPDASMLPPAPPSGPDASSPTSTCAAGPRPISLPSPNTGGIHLSICADVSGVSCPELAAMLPDAHAIELSGTTYMDDIPDTLDLATWAKEYYQGTLSLMLATDFINTLGTIWVPSGSFAPGVYVLYHAIPLPEGGEQTCSGASGPCIEGRYVPQWGITLQSLRRAREMIGNDVIASDAERELASLRGVFAYDQNLSSTPQSATPGNSNNTFGYTMMLLDDLYREYPHNSGIMAVMNEYVRYKSATIGTDGTSFYWLNTLASQLNIGFDGRGGYYNDNFVRVHYQSNQGVPLSNWYALTDNATALDLGQKAAAYLLDYGGGAFWANPDQAVRFSADLPAPFVGHTLSYATALDAMLSDARARLRANASDPAAKQEVRFVRDAYESAKRRGNAGLLGNFGVSSYLGEMLRIAIKLEGFRDVYADLIPFSAYYEDAERWVRNQASEDRVDASVAQAIPDESNADPRFDHIGSRARGTFLSDATHVTAVPFATFEDDNDGVWLMRGLYDVWKNTVQVTSTTGATVGWVNFLLNSAAPAMDVYSDVPYRGQVTIATRQKSGGITQLAVRIPSWAGTNVTITEDSGGGPQPLAGSRWGWAERYVSINEVKPGAVYVVRFPMIGQRLTVTELYAAKDWWYEGNYPGQNFPETDGQFGATFLGDVMVQPDGQGVGVPRYQRQDLAALVTSGAVNEIAPARRTVSRFVLGCSLPDSSFSL